MEIVVDHRGLVQGAGGEKWTLFNKTAEHLRVQNAGIELQVRGVPWTEEIIEFEQSRGVGRQGVRPRDDRTQILLIAVETGAHESQEDISDTGFHLPFDLNHLDS